MRSGRCLAKVRYSTPASRTKGKQTKNGGFRGRRRLPVWVEVHGDNAQTDGKNKECTRELKRCREEARVFLKSTARHILYGADASLRPVMCLFAERVKVQGRRCRCVLGTYPASTC